MKKGVRIKKLTRCVVIASPLPAVNFFSPMARYSYAIGSGADGSALQQEFKLLVREAHKRGIEVGGGSSCAWCLLVVV